MKQEIASEITYNGKTDRDYLKDYVVDNISNTTVDIMRFLMELVGGEHYGNSEFGSCYFSSKNGTKFRIANHKSNNSRTWDIEIIIDENDIEITAENFVQELFDGMGNFHFQE